MILRSTYIEKKVFVIWNSNLTGHPVFHLLNLAALPMRRVALVSLCWVVPSRPSPEPARHLVDAQ